MSRKTEHQNKENSLRNFSFYKDVPLGWMKYLAPKKAFVLEETPPPFCTFPGKKIRPFSRQFSNTSALYSGISAVVAAQGIMGGAKDTVGLRF